MFSTGKYQVMKKYHAFLSKSSRAIICQTLMRLILFCFPALLLNLSVANAADTNPNQPAEQFKQFISNPPPIADLVCEIRKSGEPAQFIRLRWQTNASFLQIESATNLEAFLSDTNPARYSYMIEARYNNIYWHKAGGMLEMTTNDNTEGSLPNTIVKSVVNLNNYFAGPVLTFGALLRLSGSTRWVDDAFTFTGDKELESSGTMTRDEQGRAKTLTSTTRNLKDNSSVEFVCQYFYDNPLALSYLPNRIERQRSGEASKQTIIIHSITLTGKPLTEAAFSLQNLAASPDIDHVITTSNEFHIMYKKGETLPVVFKDPSLSETRKPSYQMAYFLIAICLFLVPFLIFLFSKRGRERNSS